MKCTTMLHIHRRDLIVFDSLEETCIEDEALRVQILNHLPITCYKLFVGFTTVNTPTIVADHPLVVTFRHKDLLEEPHTDFTVNRTHFVRSTKLLYSVVPYTKGVS